jgi:tRNA(Ile)-lysidine synthase
MPKLIGKIPSKVYIAFSGGLDSKAVLQFMLNGRRDVELLYFNHGTEHGEEAEAFARKVAEFHGLKIHVGNLSGKEIGKRSKEEFWRDERYAFFDRFKDRKILTGHHLDDCIETYVFSFIHGKAKLIPYKRGENIIRPFLMFTKDDFRSFLKRNKSDDLGWIDDPSNNDTKYMRNLIRHELIPVVEKVNPGFKKTVRKILLKTYK